MKFLIATPAYGGLVTTKYLLALLRTIESFKRDKIAVGIYIVDSDSLITRARNKCAKYAIENGFEKMLFIDADIEWDYEQIKALLKSNSRIVGGTYPIKHLPVKLNFNALPEQAHDFSIDRTVVGFNKFKEKYAGKSGEVEVRHLPTGFMLIDCTVFKELAPRMKKYIAFDAGTGQDEQYYDFFPVQIKDGIYETEDWGFCSTCRENGISINLQTNIIVKHIGKHQFVCE